MPRQPSPPRWPRWPRWPTLNVQCRNPTGPPSPETPFPNRPLTRKKHGHLGHLGHLAFSARSGIPDTEEGAGERRGIRAPDAPVMGHPATGKVRVLRAGMEYLPDCGVLMSGAVGS